MLDNNIRRCPFRQFEPIGVLTAVGTVPALAPALGLTVFFGVVTLLAVVYTARQSVL